MKNHNLIQPSHLHRAACIYVRQSSERQVRYNLESQQRQYELTQLARELGWVESAIMIIDDDLGQSGASTANRVGFDRLVSDVAMFRIGIIFGLEVSRLARNNQDWYRLLDLCSLSGTLIADADGIYNPAVYNDRLLLGLKGTISEAELHLLKQRLVNGLFHKAQKGELQFKLPAGYEFTKDGQMIQTRDEQVRQIIELTFAMFMEIGTVNGLLDYFRAKNLRFPCRTHCYDEVVWQCVRYPQLYQTLKNPLYAGAYVFGRTHTVHQANAEGQIVTRRQTLPQHEWPVLLLDHHPGYVTWQEFEIIQQRIKNNAPAVKNQSGQAVREGSALLQGLARCGKCGRNMHVGYYSGSKHRRHNYLCHNAQRNHGLPRCQSIAGRRVDAAVVQAFLDMLQPLALELHLQALTEIKQQQQAVLTQLRLAVERAEYEADRVRRQFNAVEPENRLVARALEQEWNQALIRQEEAADHLKKSQAGFDDQLSNIENEALKQLVDDLPGLWQSPNVTDKDRKRLLRTVISEVQLTKTDDCVQIKIVWIGGAATNLTLTPPAHNRRPETIAAVDLIRQLAAKFDDTRIAFMLNRRSMKTAQGLSFNAAIVARLRREHGIEPAPPVDATSGQTFTVTQAADRLAVSVPTIYKWLSDGLLIGRQIVPGAPWEIVLCDTDIARLTAEDVPAGWLSIPQAAKKVGVSKQTVYNWVKSQKIPFIYVNKGQRKGLRVNVDSIPSNQPSFLN